MERTQATAKRLADQRASMISKSFAQNVCASDMQVMIRNHVLQLHSLSKITIECTAGKQSIEVGAGFNVVKNID